MRRCLPILGLCVVLLSFGDIRAQDASSNSIVIYSTENNQTVTNSTDTFYTVKDIFITGAKRTRSSTILRELSFRTLDTYPLSQIIQKLEQAQRQLMNTRLFRSVVVYLNSLDEQNVLINIEVTERWYFFPEPFLRLANGTFSQWNERGRKLEDLNYGIRLTQNNFSGRNDRVQLQLTNGYSKKIALQYQGLYFDEDLKWWGNINLAHGKNRELNYATENNKLLAVKNPDGFLYEYFQTSFDLVYRPAIRTRHQFTIGYISNRVGDTVAKLNENYSPSDATYHHPYISYGVSFTDYDFNPYPTRGRAWDASIQKTGINSPVNLWQLSAKGTKYWPVGKNGYFSSMAAGTIKLPFKQPYITQGFLGYGDAFLQGYENYIVDGVAGGYTKQTIGLNVINKQLTLPFNKRFPSLRNVPFKVYLKAFANAGYVHNPNETLRNALNNRMLYSTGLGLDIVAFTDLIFKIEWSFNQIGQNAIYLHQ
ncbi:MAG TPA: POTRA domain-containing protein [Flavisolibacter sp.]|nr:POTRA domain-containing protein [Flavisolibacter sp.]